MSSENDNENKSFSQLDSRDRRMQKMKKKKQQQQMNEEDKPEVNQIGQDQNLNENKNGDLGRFQNLVKLDNLDLELEDKMRFEKDLDDNLNNTDKKFNERAIAKEKSVINNNPLIKENFDYHEDEIKINIDKGKEVINLIEDQVESGSSQKLAEKPMSRFFKEENNSNKKNEINLSENNKNNMSNSQRLGEIDYEKEFFNQGKNSNLSQHSEDKKVFENENKPKSSFMINEGFGPNKSNVVNPNDIMNDNSYFANK